jgi:hypothetical protein
MPGAPRAYRDFADPVLTRIEVFSHFTLFPGGPVSTLTFDRKIVPSFFVPA